MYFYITLLLFCREALDVQHLFFREVSDSRCHLLSHDWMTGRALGSAGIVHAQEIPNFTGNSFRTPLFDLFYGVGQYALYTGQ